MRSDNNDNALWGKSDQFDFIIQKETPVTPDTPLENNLLKTNDLQAASALVYDNTSGSNFYIIVILAIVIGLLLLFLLCCCCLNRRGKQQPEKLKIHANVE